MRCDDVTYRDNPCKPCKPHKTLNHKKQIASQNKELSPHILQKN